MVDLLIPDPAECPRRWLLRKLLLTTGQVTATLMNQGDVEGEVKREQSEQEDWSRVDFPLILPERSTINAIFGLEAAGNEARG